jgi:diadenosine tetraphosphate (Ap4A) HIT family hydrolase
MTAMTTPPRDSCLSCAIVDGTHATVGGTIWETPHFHVHQDAGYAIPGFMILATRRHIVSVADFNDAEADEFALLMRQVRRAQRFVLGVEHVYFFYNEDTRHHFHLWMLPKHAWMSSLGEGPEGMRAALRHLAARGPDEADIEATRRAAIELKNYLVQGP